MHRILGEPLRRAARSAVALYGALAVAGCHPPRVEDEKAREDVTAPTLSMAITDAAADTASAAPTPEKSLLTASPARAKSIGHTSVVFKVTLEGGSDAAFKPESRRGKTRYRGELAAYRLAQALGVTNVPPALPRRFHASELRAAFGGGEGEALFDREVIVDINGTVKGAILPWIKGLEFLPLETPEWKARWQSWLSTTATLKEDDAALASQISTLIVFDVLTGNWDRWSGGNVGFERSSNRLLFIDNDGAFFDPVPAGPAEAQLALLRKTERFSKGFVSRMRGLDARALAAALGSEEPGVPLVSARTLEGAGNRLKTVLSIVDAKIAARGEKAVLAFE